MNSRKLDIFASENRLAIIAFAISLVVFLVMLADASRQVDQSKASYLLAKKRLHSSHDLTHRHLDDLSFLEKNENVLVDWQATGKLGQVNEIDWVELLLDAGSIVGAVDFRHSLSDAETVSMFYGKPVQQSSISKLEIMLNFDVKHGAAVFQFFREIGERAPSTYEVSELQIERIDAKNSKADIPDMSQITKVNNAIIATTQSQAAPTLNPADQSIRGNSTVFGGVKVTAVLKFFEIDLSKKTFQ